MKRFFAALLAVIMLMSVIPAVSLAASQYAAVVGGWLRLRADTSFESDTITSYYTGTVVEILGSYGNWYYVRTPDGRIGYMYGDFLQLGASGSNAPTGKENAYVTSHNGYGVRLRKGPGTGYRVISTYAVGTPVTVLEQGSSWCRISINGTVGYMMSQFLNFGSSNDGNGNSSVLCYATIWSSNGYGVRLRSGPSKSYGKIGVYSVGTSVAVLEKGTTWDRIRVGSRTGWMMNEFLIYQNANELTSVSLNNLYPTVGTVMSVKAMSPSHATVRYEWYVNSTLKGTSSTYTVSAADVDKVIQLKVSGTGAYSGSVWSAQTAKVISNTQISGLKLSTTAPVAGDVLKASFSPADASVAYAWKVDGYQVSNQAEYTVTANDVGKTIELIVSGTGKYSGTLSATTAAVAASSVLTNAVIRNDSNATIGAAPMVGDQLTVVVTPAQATAAYQWYRGSTAISGANGSSYTLTESDLGAQISVTVKGTGAYTGERYAAASGVVAARPVKPAIDDYAMPEAMVGKTYATQLTAQGGGQITWTLTAGNLPEGLSLSETGAITGTPAKDGTYQFTVKATNVSGNDEKTFVIKVVPIAKPQLTVGSVVLPVLTEGYESVSPSVISITNAGNADAVLLSLRTEGMNGDCFTVNSNGSGTISAGATDNTWTVQPKYGLSAGTYTANFVVYYDGGTATASITLVIAPKPTPVPTSVPTPEPTAEPTTEPTSTSEPTAEPTTEPTPTPESTAEPTAEPTPTPEPTAEPTAEPTHTPEPTAEPTATPEPTAEPTAEPTPTPEPTAEPTPEPTSTPEPVKPKLGSPVITWDPEGKFVTWTAVEGATGYKFYRVKAGGDTTSKSTTTETTYTFKAAGQIGDIFYVKAIDSTGTYEEVGYSSAEFY